MKKFYYLLMLCVLCSTAVQSKPLRDPFNRQTSDSVQRNTQELLPNSQCEIQNTHHFPNTDWQEIRIVGMIQHKTNDYILIAHQQTLRKVVVGEWISAQAFRLTQIQNQTIELQSCQQQPIHLHF